MTSEMIFFFVVVVVCIEIEERAIRRASSNGFIVRPIPTPIVNVKAHCAPRALCKGEFGSFSLGSHSKNLLNK
jgi:hypothetical protein